MPTGTASRSAPPPAPGRTPPEPLPPVQTKGQSSSARRAVCPGLFLLPIFQPLALLPARCTGSPAGSVRISDGPARSMTPPAPHRRTRSPPPPPPPPPPALIESQLIPTISLLKKPGIPFDADVSLLCISYLAIGYYGKPVIDKWRKSDQLQVRLATIGIGIVLIMEFAIFGGRTLDMKQAFYPNLIYVFLIPIGYGLLLLRLCRLIAARLQFTKIALQIMGQITIPIMYLHEPLNRYLQFAQENILIYILVGIGVPVLLAMLVQKYQWGKYIGIYSIRFD